MLLQKITIASIASLGLAFGIANSILAQIHDRPHLAETSPTSEFKQIAQPLWAKGAVTAAGVGLIGLELWWFLGSKPKSRSAQTNRGVQEVTITVDGGYEPSRVIVNAGRPVRLNFLRRDKSSCLEKVVFPDFHIAQDLELDRVTPVEFTPQLPGEYTFACGMNMFRGVVEVQENFGSNVSPIAEIQNIETSEKSIDTTSK
jgi:plastocyanin domain-containing protein